MELSISALLWMVGVPNGVQLFTGMASQITTNTTNSNSTNAVLGGLAAFGIPASFINVASSGFMFNIFAVIGITVGLSIASSALSGGGFSLIFVIPALLIVNFLFLTLSPIATIGSLLATSDPFSPFNYISTFFVIIFTALNVIGCLEFIRGSEF
jgi:hypothetical protein